MSGDAQWNPRFVAYAAASGNTPEKQLELDRERWPGGCMCGFMLWISERWTAWFATQTWRTPAGQSWRSYLDEADHASFDAFIGATDG